MQRSIRVGVFETNSSSTHSICINEPCGMDYVSLPVDEDGCCEVFPGEFGWEERTYRDATTKASYCLTHAKAIRRDETLVELLRGVIQEQTGAKEVRFTPIDPDDEYYAWGYIDHQSNDVCDEAFYSTDNLRNFIFNPLSVLVTDNDNH